jgi:hypothetical protein
VKKAMIAVGDHRFACNSKFRCHVPYVAQRRLGAKLDESENDGSSGTIAPN